MPFIPFFFVHGTNLSSYLTSPHTLSVSVYIYIYIYSLLPKCLCSLCAALPLAPCMSKLLVFLLIKKDNSKTSQTMLNLEFIGRLLFNQTIIL